MYAKIFLFLAWFVVTAIVVIDAYEWILGPAESTIATIVILLVSLVVGSGLYFFSVVILGAISMLIVGADPADYR